MPDPAMPDAPATHLQLIRVVSRLFAAYMLFWAADDLTLLPRAVLSLSRYMTLTPDLRSMPSGAFYLHYYGFETTSYLLRIALLLLAAGWFYRCGPRIVRFFSPESFTSPLAPTSNPEP